MSAAATPAPAYAPGIIPRLGLDAVTVKSELRWRGFLPANVKDVMYCKCPSACAADWAKHPLGRRVDGRTYNKHLIAEADTACAAEMELPEGEQRTVGAVDGEVLAAVEERVRWPGRYLVAVAKTCGRGERCYIAMETVVDPEWTGCCHEHRHTPRECQVPTLKAKRVLPFGRLATWDPVKNPVEWSSLYKWVDELPPATVATLSSSSPEPHPAPRRSAIIANQRPSPPPLPTPSVTSSSLSPLPPPRPHSPSLNPAPPAKRMRRSEPSSSAPAHSLELELGLDADLQREVDAFIAQKRREQQAKNAARARREQDRVWLEAAAAEVGECGGLEDPAEGRARLEEWARRVAEEAEARGRRQGRESGGPEPGEGAVKEEFGAA